MTAISRRRARSAVAGVALLWACSPPTADGQSPVAPSKQLPATAYGRSPVAPSKQLPATTDARSPVAPSNQPRAEARPAEKISGLILKVEKFQDAAARAGEADAQRLTVTVGTDVVWRDFVRDQAVSPEKATQESTAGAAEKGRKSVAAEGQPVDPALVATAEVDARTRLAIRYREATDEATEGAKTPAAAAEAETNADPVADQAEPSRRLNSKPRTITAQDLKPGLWVEIELPPGDTKHAQSLTVMQPVEDAKVPAEPASR